MMKDNINNQSVGLVVDDYVLTSLSSSHFQTHSSSSCPRQRKREEQPARQREGERDSDQRTRTILDEVSMVV